MSWWRRPLASSRYREEDSVPGSASHYWLLGALALVVAPHLLRLPGWIGAACVAVVLWRLAQTVRQWPLPSGPLRVLLALTLVGGVYIQYRTFTGLEAGSALLTAMFCLKLIEMRTLRDAQVTLFIGYFLVVAGLLFDQSIVVGAYLLLVVLALTAALISLSHPPRNRAEQQRYPRLAGSLLLQSLPLMLVLFVLFPRIPGPLWALPLPDGSGRTGLSDEMRIGDVTQLVESEQVAFRVQFHGPLPPANQLYWRGPVLMHTDGRNWQAADKDNLLAPVPFNVSGAAVRYDITLQAHDRRWLFALDLLSQRPPDSQLRFDYQLLSRDKITDTTRVSLQSHPNYQMPAERPGVLRDALALPARLNPQTRQLAMQWRQTGPDQGAIVQQALKLFRQQPFYYSRTPPALRSVNAVDEFLFQHRRGFCEHYAAAFVTLMRAAGIPARVVTGYQGGETNPLGNYLIVRQSDAHAWAEVWLPPRGWVRVDPTAAIPAQRIEAFHDSQRFASTLSEGQLRQLGLLADSLLGLRNGWDAINHQWNQWVIGYSQEKQRELFNRLGLGQFGWGTIIAMLFGLLIGLLVTVAWLLQQPPSNRHDPVQRAYLRLLRQLKRHGIEKHPNEGPHDFAQRVAQHHPELGRHISETTRLYLALRYSPQHDADQLQQFLTLTRRLVFHSHARHDHPIP